MYGIHRDYRVEGLGLRARDIRARMLRLRVSGHGFSSQRGVEVQPFQFFCVRRMAARVMLSGFFSLSSPYGAL